MKRRRLLAGLGTFLGSSSITLSTGAFTNVSADRSVRVDIADDAYAFLRMEPIPDSGLDNEDTGRSFTNGSQIAFEIPGDEEGENSDAEGVGLNSVYEFHDLVTITNQGTQPVTLHSTYDGDNLADLALVNDDGVLKDDPPTLDVGDSIDVGLYIDTHDSAIGEFDETLTIIADQPDE